MGSHQYPGEISPQLPHPTTPPPTCNNPARGGIQLRYHAMPKTHQSTAPGHRRTTPQVTDADATRAPMTAAAQPTPQPAVFVPQLRSAPDDDIDNLPEIGSEQPVWRYTQKRNRNDARRFTGHVPRIGGVPGDQLRGDLAAIIGDLLDWATRHAQTSQTQPREDSDTA